MQSDFPDTPSTSFTTATTVQLTIEGLFNLYTHCIITDTNIAGSLTTSPLEQSTTTTGNSIVLTVTKYTLFSRGNSISNSD